MARTPSEYAIHLLMVGGHREQVRFPALQDFQKWYKSEVEAKANSNDFVQVPIRNIQGEYMVIRPSAILGIRVEPIFSGSVDRYS